MSNEMALRSREAPLPGFSLISYAWKQWFSENNEKSAFNFDSKINDRLLGGTFLLKKSQYCQKITGIGHLQNSEKFV